MNVAPAVNVAQTGNVAPISARRLSVLMVTGAYYPELSGGGLQARAVVHALQDVASFTVLTTSTDRSLPSESDENGVRIHRIHVDVDSIVSQLTAAIRLTLRLARLLPRVDLVNVHGFSRKTILIATLARLFRRPFVLTLQTAGHDEPAGVRALGAVAYRAYAGADLYLSVSPGLSHAFVEAGLPAARLRQVCNAIDIQRFRPPATGERAELRAELGLPVEAPIVLFVGFFSRDKRPDLAYDAWSSEIGRAHV